MGECNFVKHDFHKTPVIGVPTGITGAVVLHFPLRQDLSKIFKKQQVLKRKNTVKLLCWLEVN